MRTSTKSSDAGRRAPARDVPLPLAEAVISCLALRDIPRLRAHYPTAMRAEDAAELRASLSGHLRAALADSTFDELRSTDWGLNLDAPASDEDLTVLLFALLLRVPGTLPSPPNSEIAPDAMRAAISACQDCIGPPLRDIVTQLSEIKLFDCRIPEGDPTYLDSRRSLQLLRAYWSVCCALVLHQLETPICYQPHPLRRIIVSLRARVTGHLTRLADGEASADAKACMDALIDCVLSGDPDELSAVPEWARQQVAIVENFLEDVRLRAGSKVFPLTHEEEVFLAHAESEMVRYHQHVKDDWARLLAETGTKAKPNELAAQGPPTSGSAAASQPAPPPIEALTANAVLLLSVLVDHAGKPWLGSTALRREAAQRRARESGRTTTAQTSTGSMPTMRRADFSRAVAELREAERIYPKGCADLRKGCAWGLRPAEHPKTEPSRN